MQDKYQILIQYAFGAVVKNNISTEITAKPETVSHPLKEQLNTKKKPLLSHWRLIGPGLLMAGAAVGVSHLIQSTRAGASFGLQLLPLVLLANFAKYPFFEIGHRYTAATGESLLSGYYRLGRNYLLLFLIFYKYSSFDNESF